MIPLFDKKAFETVGKKFDKTYYFGKNNLLRINYELGCFVYDANEDGSINEIKKSYGLVSKVWHNGKVFYEQTDIKSVMVEVKYGTPDKGNKYLFFADKVYVIIIPMIAKEYFLVKLEDRYVPCIISENHVFYTPKPFFYKSFLNIPPLNIPREFIKEIKDNVET